MVNVTRILLTSSKTGMRKVVTPTEPVKVEDLGKFRKEIREKYEDFDGVNFVYEEENT
jgi:hypothetical protein